MAIYTQTHPSRNNTHVGSLLASVEGNGTQNTARLPNITSFIAVTTRIILVTVLLLRVSKFWTNSRLNSKHLEKFQRRTTKLAHGYWNKTMKIG